jgi:RHS repeat-associated protein
VEWRGFDAFGAPRSGTWADKSPNILGPSTATAHGFTQHEHLDGLGLIHMNGRVYDYALGRFLGVDPFIQFPSNSQSLNPYSYILNNPLAGTDPTGYCVAETGTQIKTCVKVEAVNEDGSKSTVTTFNARSKADVARASGGALPGVSNNGGASSQTAQGAARQDRATQGVADVGAGNKSGLDTTVLSPVRAVIDSREDLAEGRIARSAGDVVGGFINAQKEFIKAYFNGIAEDGPGAIIAGPIGPAFRLRETVRAFGSLREAAALTQVANEAGVVREFVTETDQIFFRVFSEKPFGGFLTAVKPSSSAFAQEALALPRSNKATMIQEVFVPAGTRLRRSRAAPMSANEIFPARRGGGEQFELIDPLPRSNFGEGVPFK